MLVTYQEEPFITDKDIVVYKMLKKKGNKFYAPIVYWDKIKYVYKVGEHYPKKSNKDRIECLNNCGDWNIKMEYYVDKGWLHAYTDLQKLKDQIEMYDDRTVAVVEMIIPKGSQYYIGTRNDICSDCLIWTKESYANGNLLNYKK